MTGRSGRNITTGNIPGRWDRETDVVIAGYGGAGAAAAISAHDAGARVLIVESMPRGGGTLRQRYR